MAINSDNIFKATMTPEMLAASDRRAEELKSEWSALRAELPSEARDRLDNARRNRLRR